MTPMSVFMICFIVLHKVKSRSQCYGYMKMVNYVVIVQALNTMYALASRLLDHKMSATEVIALSLPFLYVGKLELDIQKGK